MIRNIPFVNRLLYTKTFKKDKCCNFKSFHLLNILCCYISITVWSLFSTWILQFSSIKQTALPDRKKTNEHCFFKIIILSFFTTVLVYTKSNRGNKTVLGMMHAFIPCLGTQINLNFRGRHEKSFLRMKGVIRISHFYT